MMSKSTTLLLAVLMSLVGLTACSGGSDEGIITPTLNEGALGEACYEDGTCDEGLICDEDTNLCVEDGPAVGEEGGACFDDGTCNEGLACVDGVCSDSGVEIVDVPKFSVRFPNIRPFSLKLTRCPAGMVLIEGGEFQMGSDSGSKNEKPAHSVTLSKDYCMDRYEFTNGDRDALVAKGLDLSHVEEFGDETFNGKNQPMVAMRHDEAEYLCEVQGKRLPTEAEWEFAARGGNQAVYATADGTLTDANACWDPHGVRKTTCEVGTFKANALGLYDMTGNVWELVSDWYGAYPQDDVVTLTDPQGPKVPGPFGSTVMRGGGYNVDDPTLMTTTTRSAHDPEWHFSSVGFRCVQEALDAGK